MQFFRRASEYPARLGIFPGTFNPPTIAHLGLARAALHTVDEVVLVLPRVFPHKHYSGATFEQRIELLQLATASEPRFSIASSSHGLFVDIARECRADYGPDVRLSFLCGRDAAERIAAWDYGHPGAWEEMLREFDLLVAPRAGEYRPAAGEGARFVQVPLEPACDTISASDVRRRIGAGEPWEAFVPEEIHARVREIYKAM